MNRRETAFLADLAQRGARLRFGFAQHSARIDLPGLPDDEARAALDLSMVVALFSRLDPDVCILRIGDAIVRKSPTTGAWSLNARNKGVPPWNR